jgi:hypothetical protein
MNDEFTKAIRQNNRQIYGQVKLLYNGGSFNTTNETTVEASSPDNQEISDINGILDSNYNLRNYAGLERDYFKLDGTMILPNYSTTEKNEGIGFVGDLNVSTINLVAKDDWDYVVLFFWNFTFYFGEEYPIDFTVEIKTKNMVTEEIEDYTVEIKNNDKKVVVVEPQTSSTEIYSKLVSATIKVTKWKDERHRVRLNKIEAGYTNMLESTDFASFKVLKQIDLLNSTTPNNSFELVVDNYKGNYNINDHSLTEMSIAIPYIGVKTETQGIQYYSLGNYQYSEIRNSSDGMTTLSFKGGMEEIATESIVVVETIPTKAKEVIEDVLDNRKSTIELSYNPTIENPQMADFSNKREQLQALSTLTCSYVQEDNTYPDVNTFDYETKIKYESIKKDDYIDDIPLTRVRTIPVVNKTPDIYNIKFSYDVLGQQSTEKTTIYEATLKGTKGDNDYVYDIETVTSIPFNASTGEIYVDGVKKNVSLINRGYFLINQKISGDNETATIKIIANTYETGTSEISVPNPEVFKGDEISIVNNYLTTPEQRDKVSENIFGTYTEEFELETFGDPAIDCGKAIKFDVVGGKKKGIVESVEIDYDGGLTGVVKGVCQNV